MTSGIDPSLVFASADAARPPATTCRPIPSIWRAIARASIAISPKTPATSPTTTWLRTARQVIAKKLKLDTFEQALTQLVLAPLTKMTTRGSISL